MFIRKWIQNHVLIDNLPYMVGQIIVINYKYTHHFNCVLVNFRPTNFDKKYLRPQHLILKQVVYSIDNYLLAHCSLGNTPFIS